MGKLGPVRFRVGQWVAWTDEDEAGLVKPHVGKVEAHTALDDNRVYMVEETDPDAKNGYRLVLVLEEELSRLRTD